MKSSPSVDRIVWVDLEMTGLDVDKDKIIEIACIITDKSYNILEESEAIVIKQSKEVMDNMGPWCTKQHGLSGLTEKVLNSATGLAEAESHILKLIKKHCTEKMCSLAGNSIHMDRAFLAKYMPTLCDYLHYRLYDVSTIKLLCLDHFKAIAEGVPPKKETHRALDDIKESIEEMKYYVNRFKMTT